MAFDRANDAAGDSANAAPQGERCIPSENETEWREALAGVPHAFAHTVECCRAAQASTGWPTFLYTLTGGDSRVVCPVSEREYQGYVDWVTPFQFAGPAGTGPSIDFRERWHDLARSRGIVAEYQALHPVTKIADHHLERELHSTNTLYLADLAGPPEALIAGFDRGRRRQLRDYASQFKTHIVTDRDALAAFFVEQFPPFADRVGVSRAARFNADSLRMFAGLPNVLLVGAASHGGIEAVYLFGFTPYVADCVWNVSTPSGRQFATLLLWYGMLAMKSRGLRWLSLGGGTSRLDRVALAKERFRPATVPMQSVRRVFRSEIYEYLCRARGADPWRGGYFPAYHDPAYSTA